MKKADRGGTTPYWLGAAQLEAGGSSPVRFENLSHRRKQPLAPCSTPIEQWLNTGICCFPCYVDADRMAKLECPLQVVGCWLMDGRTDVSLGSMIWRLLPMQLVPPLHLADNNNIYLFKHDKITAELMWSCI